MKKVLLVFILSSIGLPCGYALESAIGIENSLVYESPVPLRVKKLEEKSPLWLRIIEAKRSGESYTYTFGCIGNETGTFDIVTFLEPEDGSENIELPSVTMSFFTSLPGKHRVGVNQSQALRVPPFGFARLILIAIGVLWLAIPAWFIGRAVIRRLNRPKPFAERETLPIDLLLPLLDKGDVSTLKSCELALIERLLHAHISDDIDDDVSIQGVRDKMEAYLYQRDLFDQQRVITLARELIAVRTVNQNVGGMQ